MRFGKYIFLILTVLLAFASNLHASSWPQDRPVKLFVFKIDDSIDPRMSRRVDLALKKADKDSVDLVIIDMDTYGGALNDADDIRTRLLEYDKPVYVFINKDAASAGALISIACDSIYMAPGASIGAATVVTGQGEAAPDKYQSYMRSIMRSTAEAKGRNPRIAEAMVDQNIQVDSVSQEGKVITFTTSEAIKYGFCEAQVNGIPDIMRRVGADNYERQNFELSATERFISFFLNPFISGILIMVILGGIYFELQSPGVGFPLLAAVTALIFYLVPYYLNGLAENWEIIAFCLGIVLLALEFLVIPGFGVAGVTGFALVLGSLVLVMLDNDWFDFSQIPSGALTQAFATLLGATLSATILAVFLGARARQFANFSRLALNDRQESKKGYNVNFKKKSMLGLHAQVYSRLRPSGKVEIDNEIHDAYTQGDFIDKGEIVEVIEEVGNSLRVKRVP